MATNLIEQSQRAEDVRFLMQVRACLMRDQPDMLRAPGLLAVADALAEVVTGPYIVGSTLAAKRENAGKARAFGQRLTVAREQTVAHVAQLVAGATAIITLDVQDPPQAPRLTMGELLAANETTLIGQVRVAVKALAELE